MSRKWFIGAFAAFFLSSTFDARADVNVGDKPVLEFKAANGGAETSLAKYKGKIIVVDFWATWCGPCMAEADHMVKVNATYAPKGMQFIGISLDTNVPQMLKVAQEKGFNWPQYCDGQQWKSKPAGDWGVQGIPSTFIIGPDGAVLWKGHPGGIDGPLADAFKNHPPQLVDPKIVADATAIADKIEAALKEDGGGAAALKLLSKFPAAAKADADVAARVSNIEKQLNEYATKALADIEPLVAEKKYIEAVAKLTDLSRSLGTLPVGAAAKKRLAELVANPETKAQVAAAQRATAAEDELAIATRLQGDKKHEQAYLKFKTIATTFADTPSGATAKEAVATYEKDAAFVARANDSVATAKAKGMMGMAMNYVRAGKPELAKKKYEEIIAAFPGTTAAAQAKAAIAEIAKDAPR